MSEAPFLGRYAVLTGLDFAAKACGFGVTVLIARHFGAAGLGVISLAQQIAAYGVMASTWGLDLHAVKHVIARPDDLGTTAGTVIALRLALSLPCYAIVLVIASLVPPLPEAIGLIALFGLTCFTGAVSVIWVSQATQRTHVFGLANLCIQGGYLGLVSLGAFLHLGRWYVPAALLVAETLVAVGLLAWMSLTVETVRRPMGWRRSLRFLGGGAPIGGAQILRTVSLGSDIVLVGLLLTLTEVGWYSGAYRIFMLGISVSAGYFIILFPHFARHAGASVLELRRELRVSLGRVLLLAVPILAVGGWIAGNVLARLYGPSFEMAEATLRILLLVNVIALVNGHFRHALIVLGKQRQDLRNVALAAGVHVGLKLALIPVLGMEGAALGALLGESVLMILGWTALRALLPPASAL